jgi:hypothetical protein
MLSYDEEMGVVGNNRGLLKHTYTGGRVCPLGTPSSSSSLSLDPGVVKGAITEDVWRGFSVNSLAFGVFGTDLKASACYC